MSRLWVKHLNVPGAGVTDPGEAQSVGHAREKTIQFIGGDGEWVVEISLDGTEFAPAITGITAPGIFALPHACTHVRVNPVTNTTPPTVIFGGYME